jgi:sulfate transport system substrate-binding protein
VTLVNASYDPTRALWRDMNEHFTAAYERQTGQKVTIRQSHGGSSTQARAVIDGLDADVTTLASFLDTDAIAKRGLMSASWAERLPNASRPYYSTVVFVVRRGNPKGIHDWPDLVKQGVEVITPNPKTSGNGYVALFAAWGSVTLRGGSTEDATAYVTRLYRQVPVLDSGARSAAATFAQRGIGDVHLTWENEAHLEVAESSGDLEIIQPPISILAEPQVAVVDANVDRKHTRQAAEAYLAFVYTPEAQEILAKHHYRPADEAVLKRHSDAFPSAMKLFPITAIATDWSDAHARLVGDGSVFDGIYRPGLR